MHECNETRCYGWQDSRKMQNMWKTMYARESRWIERCREAIEQKPTSMDRTYIKKLLRGQKDSRSIYLVIERWRDCDKKQLKSSIDSLGVEELSRLLKNSFSKKRKTQAWMQSRKLLNQRSKQHIKLSKNLSSRKMSSI